MHTFRRFVLALIAALCGLNVAAAAPRRHPAPPTQTATVAVSNTKFEPRTLRVKAGTTVTWENKEGVHTITADKGAFEKSKGQMVLKVDAVPKVRFSVTISVKDGK